MLGLRLNYARALYNDPAAMLDAIREAVETCEDLARTARRVLGGSNPLTVQIELSLRIASLLQVPGVAAARGRV